jgi:glycosyltransferase involved in cell wall biosynthesis
MPQASIVVPAFNVARTIADTLRSLQAQTLRDIEILVLDDGSTDYTLATVRPFLKDQRIRYIAQANRGLAGARNRGITEAKSDIIGFCDADDLWHPDKMRRHVAHFNANPQLGLSYSGSELIDEMGRKLGIKQSPRLKNVTAAHILKRNPIGNGSAPVLRREALRDIASQPFGSPHIFYFDETFRQSEDIECWLRLALLTDWDIEGIPGALTQYRVAIGGLSANTERQLASWENVMTKLRPVHPDFFEKNEPAARAYQMRYLARRAISAGDGALAYGYLRSANQNSLEPFRSEPLKSFSTLAAAWVMHRLKITPLALRNGVSLSQKRTS